MQTTRRRPVTKAADSTGPEKRLARAINQGFNILDAGAMTEYARDRVTRGDLEGFIDALPWADLQDHLIDQAVPAMIEPAADAARLEVGKIAATGTFNHVDDLSYRYAQQQAGQLIVAISNTQRDTIRQILGTAMKGDLTKDGAARRIRQAIGLDPRKAQAVVNYEARLLKHVPKGYSAARWEQAVAKKTRTYHARLLRRRADMIARTEIITAENLGKYATWTDSIARGINGADSRKEWSPGPGACDQCAAMAGETVRWDAAFSNGNLMPPAHPNCRCTAQLLPAPYKNPALNPRPINWTDPLGHRHTIDTDQYGQGRRLLQEPPGPKPATPDMAAKATDADDLTYESTLHWSDDKLADKINYYAENGDDAALDRILEIIDQRAEAEAAQAARYAAEAAAREEMAAAAARVKAAEDARYAEQARISRERYEATLRAIQAEKEADALNAVQNAGLIKPDPNPVTNPAVRRERQLTAKEQAGEQYQEYLNTQMAKALDDLNGVFFNRANHAEARQRGFTEETLFTAPWQVANKYASDELKDWWLQNGRESLKSYRYKITQNQSDKWAADAVRKRGHETGQAKRDRSIF